MADVLRGQEVEVPYTPSAGGIVAGEPRAWATGAISEVSPTPPRLDVHLVRNGLADAVSISIHVYGANIGAQRRHKYDAATGEAATFISGDSREPNHARGALGMLSCYV